MAENNIADAGISGVADVIPGLTTQTFGDLSSDTLSPLTMAVMSRQATINIGTIGHVAHGKSTVVGAISSVRTMQFKQEAKKNLTIHLGYANAKIFKCPECPAPECYRAFGSRQADATKCVACQTEMQLMRHVSFVDCPGHDILMATMLNGAAIMDGALLLVAANETFPQPQTLEHLKAVEIMRLSSVIVLQNKIDLVREGVAKEQYQSIKAYLKNTPALNSPVIPISAQLKYNIDLVLEYICHVPVPRRRFNVPLRMTVVRSFDVNRPGEEIEKLAGGVAGGSVLEGVLKMGMEIEVRPGLRLRETDESGAGVVTCQPLLSKALTLNSERVNLLYAVPGGLIGVGTTIDPSLTRQNKLVGNTIGTPGTLPPVAHTVDAVIFLLPTLLGARTACSGPTQSPPLRRRPLPSASYCCGGGAEPTSPAMQRQASFSAAGEGAPPPPRRGTAPTTGRSTAAAKVHRVAPHETLLLVIGSRTVGATALLCRGDHCRLELAQPACCEIGEKFAVGRRIDGQFRLIGWGTVKAFKGAGIAK